MDWQLTSKDAKIKLKRLYPVVLSFIAGWTTIDIPVNTSCIYLHERYSTQNYNRLALNTTRESKK